MQHEFLLEIGTEEIPADYILPALDNMKKIMALKLKELDLPFGRIRIAATPRRLTLCIDDLADRQPDRLEEILGPPKKAAFNKDNQPTKAAMGFARSRGATVDDMKIVTTAKGEYLMLRQEKKGEETAQLLSDFLPELIADLPFPKSMRWGANRTSFARPIQWLLALFGSKIVPFRVNDITSSNQTRGHRFMAPEEFKVQNFNGYLADLAKAGVLVDLTQRRQTIQSEIDKAATEAGGRIIPDEELLNTVTNLVEFPLGICGEFDKKFLQLPREVLITSMRVHQKYFPVADNDGNLMANFVAVNNTRVKNSILTRQGHQRVLRARLEDALFFFKKDRQHRLSDRVDSLAGVIFQAHLGTMLEKTERLLELSTFLTQTLAPAETENVKRAAWLAKADLVTDMVNEFPALQGNMGMHYALHDGEPPAAAKGIMEHYMPVRAGSPLPSEIHGAIVGLADRLDSIAGCFGIGKIPTGTADPFGLRRLALGLLHILENLSAPLSLSASLKKAIDLYGDKLNHPAVLADSMEFIKNRYINDLIGRGLPSEAVEAVTSVSFDDIVDCRKRIDALVAISDQPTFTLLAAAFKRVNNIIKDHRGTAVQEKLLTEPGEKELFATLQAIRSEALPLVAEKQYEQALTVILRMKEPVDAFFDDVMVMVEDEKIRNNRLSLLAGIAELFLTIGDFSKMYQMGRSS